MSIIIRLQNLPWSANSADIRHFFCGLEIPDGGVHIIGGESGDAFIAFKNDDDARQAMLKDNLNINENRIRLFLSSRFELQQLIEKIREGSVNAESLSVTDNFQPRECHRSPVPLERKSPDKNIRSSPDKNIRRKSPDKAGQRRTPDRTGQRKSPDRSGRRKSPDRTDRRRSPDRTGRRSPGRTGRRSPGRTGRRSPGRTGRRSPGRTGRRSPDRTGRRSPDRTGRRSPDRTGRRSPDRAGRRRSPDRTGGRSRNRVAQRIPLRKNSRSEERGARRSLERVNRRSPNLNARNRSRERSQRSSRRSRSPIASRNRSRSFDRHSQVERRQLPTNRKDCDSHSDYLDSSNNRDFHFPKEELQNPETFRNPSRNENFQCDAQRFEPSQLYERRSPTKIFQNSNEDCFNVFSNYAKKVNSDLLTPRNLEESPYSGFPPESQPMRDQPPNSRREFGIHPPFHEDSVPFHDKHITPFLDNLNPPPFEEPNFYHPSMPRNASGTFNLNNEQANFQENFSAPIFKPQAMDRFSRDEGRFPNQPSRDERLFRMNFQEPPFDGNQLKNVARDTNYNFHENNAGFMSEPPNYCVRMLGFGPNDTYKQVQSVLKGFYAPQKNIQFEVSNRGYKTVLVYVKMSNKEDFHTVLQSGVYYLNESRVEVDRCPDEIYWQTFPRDRAAKRFDGRHSQDLVYMLKGLPYSTTETDIINFFKGLKLVDLLILYHKDGKATGTGYVEFENPNDYKIAFERNGKKIAHRYIELLKSSTEDVSDAKKSAECVSKPFQDILQITCTQGNNFFENSGHTMSHQQQFTKHPLCVLLSGLPPNVRSGQIYEFFSESGITPHAVHILLNGMQQTNGSAYVEFLDPFDLDIALKQHRKIFFDFSPVSIKQVLFEEMVKILDTNQAVHAFGNRNAEKRTKIPEKAPYIWDPDEFESINHEARDANSLPIWRDDSQNFVFDNNQKNVDNRQNIQVFDYSHNGSDDFPSGRGQMQQFEKPLHVKHFDENMDACPAQFSPASTSPVTSQYVSPPMRDVCLMDSKIGRETNRPFEAHSNKRREDVRPFVNNSPEYKKIPQFSKAPETRPIVPYAIEEEEVDRTPVKFEMKTRQSVVKNKNTKINDAFGTSEEGYMRLKKLSPIKVDKSSIKSQNTNKDKPNKIHGMSNVYKKVPNADIKHEPKLLEKNFKSATQKNFDEERCANVNSKNSAAVKKSVSENKLDFNKRKGVKKNESMKKGKDQFKTDFRGHGIQNKKDCRNSDNLEFDSDDIFQLGDVEKFEVVTSSCVSFGEIGSTVQASNVHPDIGLSELMDFFHGFNLRTDDIIRRFTEFGVATGDIRVAFHNSQEAQKAIHKLNYKVLRELERMLKIQSLSGAVEEAEAQGSCFTLDFEM